MLKQILLTLAAIGILASLGGLAGLAVFTDQATVPANAFDTGNVAISTTPTTALVTFTAMAPGDSVQPAAGLVVSNDGSLELRYAISSVTTEDTLAAALDLTIKTIDVTTPGTPCDDFDGTSTLYGPADLGAVAGINLVGDPAQGVQGSERVLTASTTETLCFRVELPLASTGPEGASTTATFTFDAEQTQSNP